MNIELYIADRLCDLDSSNTSIVLKRVFLKPTELSSKDASKSYSITLPTTANNNEIFNHVNVEEISGKFRLYPNARLYVGGVLILNGKFMLTEITRNGYKGNLGVPRRKVVKDIFAHKKMAEAGEWILNDFRGFESISKFNQEETPPCIFPLVLYGLLPKEANYNGYSGKDLLDYTVRFALDDFPPSVNCIQMLKKIFEQSELNLSGTALRDERINSLYVSYKNPNDYQFDWGAHDIHLTGDWKHYNSGSINRFKFDSSYIRNEDTSQFNLNVFKATNHNYQIQEDNGGNINIGGRGRTRGIAINIPYSALYKVELTCKVSIGETKEIMDRGIGVNGGELNTAPLEIHLVRNLDKGLGELNFNNKFAYENIEQNINNSDAKFPRPHRVNFIDPKQDKNFISGFSFGRHDNGDYRNPLNDDFCNPMAISGGRSWDFMDGEGTTERAYSAVKSPSYVDSEWDETGDFKVELEMGNAYTSRDGDKKASGEIQQVIWLDKGDTLELLLTTVYKKINILQNQVISDYSIEYDLKISPFQHELDWLTMDEQGSSRESMSWRDESSFTKGQFDLMKTLPTEIKINDWIENFCKAFNLELHDTGDGFSLDLRDRGTVKNTSIIIDLDDKASVEQSFNLPLNAPYSYELGFTVDTDEQGWHESQEINEETGKPIDGTHNDGGGTFIADSEASSIVNQTSTFSYNWFKTIQDERNDNTIELPVITDKEIWEHNYDYKEMMAKVYFDKAQRFWYKSGISEIYRETSREPIANALVSNEHKGAKEQRLDYKDTPNSIMRNLFILLKNDKSYTVVECYLTPQEYSNLDIALVRFNGDLYNVAEIDGYDPLGQRKCTLKLIRKI